MERQRRSMDARGLEALAQVRPELDVLREDELVSANVDVAHSARIVLGSLPGLRAYGRALSAEIPSFDPCVFDRLEKYARATSYLQAVCAEALRARRASPPGDALWLRQRAFTLLARAYDQVRRHLSFLRWNEGDLDQLAPALYAYTRAAHCIRAEPELMHPLRVTLPSTPVPASVSGGAPRRSRLRV